VLSSSIKKQLADTRFTKNYVSSSANLKRILLATLVTTFIASQFIPGSMIYLLGFLQSLQLVLHLPMFSIIIPANVAMIFEYILAVVMFDILDPSYTTELVFNFDSDSHKFMSSKIIDQVRDLGYGSFNSWLTLGSISIFLFIYLC
jgi:hypothetical protein